MLPFRIWRKLANPDIIIPYYHMVSDDEVLHTKHLYPHKSKKQFSDDLDCILKFFSPVSMSDVMKYAHTHKSLLPNALHLTFDDGFREMYDIVAPILLRKGIPATFFINSSFVDNKSLCYQHKASLLADQTFRNSLAPHKRDGIRKLMPGANLTPEDIKAVMLSIAYRDRFLLDDIAKIMEVDFSDYLSKTKPYLTIEQIEKLLSDGFSIGAHSIDHPFYADLSLEDQIHQTSESASFIKRRFNLSYSVFAFPHSDRNVSQSYFNTIKKSGLVDVSFGTSGLIADCVPNHFQRISFEKPLWPAKNILSYQYAKRLYRILRWRNTITRPEFSA